MYYELKDRCGDFEGKCFPVSITLLTIVQLETVHSNELQIDNGTHPFLLNRFCLGRMTNIKRTEQIEKIRCALGRGVKLTGGCGNADGMFNFMMSHQYRLNSIIQSFLRICPNQKYLCRVQFGMHQRSETRRQFNQFSPINDRKYSTKLSLVWNCKNGQTVMVSLYCF